MANTSTILAAGTDAIVPTIFRFPIALTGHIEIEGDMADEAMNTVGIDLRNALESDDAKSIDLDNGGVLSLTGFEIDGLPIKVTTNPTVEQALTAALTAFCDANGLPQRAAEELLCSDALAIKPDAYRWLTHFIAAWDGLMEHLDEERDAAIRDGICPTCIDPRCDGCAPADTPALDDSAHRHEMEA